MKTVKLAAKSGPRASWTLWEEALAGLASGDVDYVRSGGALTGMRCDGKPETLGKLHGTLWGRIIDEIAPTAVVVSYDTPIAVLVGGRWFMPAVKWSATTSGHQSKVATATGAVSVETPEDLLAAVAGDAVAETALVLARDGVRLRDALATARALEGVPA